MPYQSLVNDLNQKCDFTINNVNHFEYKLDGEKLFSQVQYAMSRSTTEERDAALKNVILYNFTEDCEEYFDASSRFGIYIKTLGFAASNEQSAKREKMYNVPKFYDHYLNIVTEMVKDIDPNYEVKPFFGLTEEEAVDMQLGVVGTYSSKDAWKYMILEVRHFSSFYEDIERSREYKDKGNTVVYDYTKLTNDKSVGDRLAKERIHSTYMLKKILEEELKERGWWWRVRNWFGECKEMRDLIKAADKTLKDVKFPLEKGSEVEESFEEDYIHPGEKDIIKAAVRDNYAPLKKALEEKRIAQEKKLEEERLAKEAKLEEERLAKEAKLKEIDANKDKDVAAAAEKDLISQLFDPRYRPTTNADVLNDQIKIGNQLSKVYLYHNKEIDPAAKKVFKTNMEKIVLMKEHMTKYVDPALNRSEEEIQNHYDKVTQKFDQVERELIYQNPDYVPITVEDVDKAMTIKEPVSVTLENENEKPELSAPVTEEKSLEKEPVAKN